MNGKYDELDNIEYEEVYVVESIDSKRKLFSFGREKDKKAIDVLKQELENSDYAMEMKIKIYNEMIEKEELYKKIVINAQKKCIYKIGALVFILAALFSSIVNIERYAHLTSYTSANDISITDLKSVGALFFMPLAGGIILLMLVCIVYLIILCKRSCITKDPHDNVSKRHETILRICNERIAEYRDEINRLQMKMLHFKSGINRL